MSGFDITIPGALLAGLYKDTLIAAEAHAPAAEKPVVPAAAEAPHATVVPPAAATPREPVASPAPQAPVQQAQAQAQVQPPPISTTPSFLGNNAKGILIVVKDNDNVHLAEDALQLLSGILAACRLNMGDVAVLNAARHQVSFAQLRQQMTVNYCFFFDVNIREMQLSFAIPPFQVFSHDNCTFLCAPALSGMLGSSEEAKLLKTKLWVCLKQIFNV